MRTVVCAYGEVGHACLSELIELGVEVPLVVTHEDSPGEKIWFSSVAELASSSGIRVISPPDANAAGPLGEIAAVAPEFLFSFYFRHMMRPALLATASRGALNMHGSLLPRYRGRSPVNWALLHGERETGVTLHYMDAKPDHGDVVAQQRVEIASDDTALTLTRKLAAAARAVLREAVPLLATGKAPRRPQDHSKATYFGGRRPEDGQVDWQRPAEEIRNLVRAVTDPWPGAFSWFRGRRLMIWAARTAPAWSGSSAGEIRVGPEGAPLVATGEGGLLLLDVELDGERRCTGAEWVRAWDVRMGDRFEGEPSAARGEMHA